MSLDNTSLELTHNTSSTWHSVGGFWINASRTFHTEGCSTTSDSFATDKPNKILDYYRNFIGEYNACLMHTMVLTTIHKLYMLNWGKKSARNDNQATQLRIFDTWQWSGFWRGWCKKILLIYLSLRFSYQLSWRPWYFVSPPLCLQSLFHASNARHVPGKSEWIAKQHVAMMRQGEPGMCWSPTVYNIRLSL